MIENEIVIVRGFDLFFNNVSSAMLQHIADKVGEGSTYDQDANSVTYTFTQNCRCDFGSLKCIHSFVSEQGLKLAEEFGCIYEANELYLTISPSVADWFTATGGDITKPILI